MAARKHIMLSGRFNNKETTNYMKEVKRILEEKGAPVFMVNAGPGQSFANPTMMGMACAGAMVAFCTEDYGEKTGAKYETYYELKYAYENDVPIIPVKLSPVYPPQPPEPEGRGQNSWIFTKSLIYIDDSKMADPQRVCSEITASLRAQGLVQTWMGQRPTDLTIEGAVQVVNVPFTFDEWFGSGSFDTPLPWLSTYSEEIQQEIMSGLQKVDPNLYSEEIQQEILSELQKVDPKLPL